MKSCTVLSVIPTCRIFVPGRNPVLSSIQARSAGVQTIPDDASASEYS